MHAYMFVALHGSSLPHDLPAHADTSINKENRLKSIKKSGYSVTSAVSHTANCKLGKTRIYNNGNVHGIFGGHLVDHDEIPWNEVIEALLDEKYNYFNTFKSAFFFAINFSGNGETYIITDRCSQFPVFYGIFNNSLWCSTTLSTFFDCLPNKKINEKWMTDFVLFNVVIGGTTPLSGVHRPAAASVTRIRADGSETVHEYAPVFRGEIPDRSERDTKNEIYSLFKERIPKYFYGLSNGTCAASVTSGFDIRLCLSLKPEDIDTRLYTYGIDQCEDLREGKKIAQALGLEHHAIIFDDALIATLFDAAKTVTDYSGETLNILRSTLLPLYRRLSSLGMEYIVSGVAGDIFYRGSGNVPHIFSPSAVTMFNTARTQPPDLPFLGIFNKRTDVQEHFAQNEKLFEQRYNWSALSPAERLLTFAQYEFVPKHWTGEIVLAGHYLDFVSPYFDAAIREMAYRTNLSTLTFGHVYKPQFPTWKRNALFASIIERNRILKEIPIHGLKPGYYAAGTKESLLLGKLLHKIPDKIRHWLTPKSEVQLEEWRDWLYSVIYPGFKKNYDDFLLAEYIRPDIIEKVIRGDNLPDITPDNHYLGGKLITMELVLRKCAASPSISR